MSGELSKYRNLELAKKTNALWQYYLKNKKAALQNLKGQISCPEFPPLIWEAILLNQFIDLNKIHAVRVGNAADEEVVHETG